MPDPQYALVGILTAVAMRPFFEMPDSRAKAEAQKRGGYVANAKHSCLYTLLLPVLLVLWWWYAVATDQPLLGIIPTVGMVATILAVTVEMQARKAAKR